MTIDTQKLAESIDRVMELLGNIQVTRSMTSTYHNNEIYQSIGKLSPDIIKQQGGVIRELWEALATARKRIDYLGYCTGTETHITSNESAFLPRLDKALSLSAPLVDELMKTNDNNNAN